MRNSFVFSLFVYLNAIMGKQQRGSSSAHHFCSNIVYLWESLMTILLSGWIQCEWRKMVKRTKKFYFPGKRYYYISSTSLASTLHTLLTERERASLSFFLPILRRREWPYSHKHPLSLQTAAATNLTAPYLHLFPIPSIMILTELLCTIERRPL